MNSELDWDSGENTVATEQLAGLRHSQLVKGPAAEVAMQLGRTEAAVIRQCYKLEIVERVRETA